MTGFVIHHIEELQLYVEVIWVGPNLANITNELTRKYKYNRTGKKVVLVSWAPSELAIPGDRQYSVVTFPPCEDMQSSKLVGCKYDLQRLLKLAWNKLKESALPAYEVLIHSRLLIFSTVYLVKFLFFYSIMLFFQSIRKVQFDHSDYQDLVERSRQAGPESDAEVACGWLKDNEHKWQDWVWSNDDKGILYIGGIFPLSGISFSAKAIVIGEKYSFLE